MAADNVAAWDRHAAAYQAGARLGVEAAHYGPDIADESELALLGNVKGKRVLELGCGGAQNAIAFAKQGATAIGVDASKAMLDHARTLADKEQVKVELRQGDLADLSFLRGDSVDIVFSANAFGYVEDLQRVFRQAHRVLVPKGVLVFSITHPAYEMIDDDHPLEPLRIRRSYFDRSPIDVTWDGIPFTEHRHLLGDVITALVRSGYRIDTVLEPEPTRTGPRSAFWRDTFQYVPRTLVVKAKKD